MSNVDLLGKIFFILDLNQLKFIYFIYMSKNLSSIFITEKEVSVTVLTE
jgi:hypothetical protein